VFAPLLPDDRFLEMLAASDVCLVTQQKSVADIVFPSKVITLMSSGRAIVASTSPGSEVSRVVREADAGILVAPEDPVALLGAISALRDQPDLRNRLGTNGRAFAERFWEKQRTLSILEAHLLEIASRGKSTAMLKAPPLNSQLIVNSEEGRQ
jgi:colanic acid biosynthesis glycosyl transferase WcaI